MSDEFILLIARSAQYFAIRKCILNMQSTVKLEPQAVPRQYPGKTVSYINIRRQHCYQKRLHEQRA